MLQIPSTASIHSHPRPQLVPGISDTLLQLFLPITAYWAFSLFFHILNTYDICPEYRLHKPAEGQKRNQVSRYEVVRDMVVQQVIQTLFGLAIIAFDPVESTGKQGYEVAIWAQRLRQAERSLPNILAFLGVDSIQLSKGLLYNYPALAALFAGGHYHAAPRFTSWQTFAAKAIYHIVIPMIQFTLGMFIVDTWQYFFTASCT